MITKEEAESLIERYLMFNLEPVNDINLVLFKDGKVHEVTYNYIKSIADGM